MKTCFCNRMTCKCQRLKEKAAHPFSLKLNYYFEPSSLCLYMSLLLCDDSVSALAGSKCSRSLSVSDEIPVQLLLLNSFSYLASRLLELDAAGIFHYQERSTAYRCVFTPLASLDMLNCLEQSQEHTWDSHLAASRLRQSQVRLQMKQVEINCSWYQRSI